MVQPEQDSTIQERLTEIANATGNAVLVLNADIDGACFRDVLTELDGIEHQEVLTLILNSLGGEIEYAFWIAKSIRRQCDYLEVMVPDRAKSAATLIALAADRIYLGRFGELGPLDPQVRNPAGGSSLRSPLESVKGLEFLRRYYLETFNMMVSYLRSQAGMDIAHALEHSAEALSPVAESLYRSVNYRELGEAVQRLAIGEEYAKETMYRWGPLEDDAIEDIVRQLVWEYPDHGHIIDVEEAKRIGLTNVVYLHPGLESLLFEAITSTHDLHVEAALPDVDDSAAGGDDNASPLGGEHGNESGTPCDQQS